MPGTESTTVSALMLAAPGLLILAWAAWSLLMWAQQRESRIQFEKDVSDQHRLVLAGVDVLHGLSPVIASFAFQLYYLSADFAASTSVMWVCWGFALLYPFLYYRILRPLYVRVRLMQRNRVRSPPSGA